MTGRCSLLLCGLLGSLVALGSTAIASETLTYSYDERGRLVQVSRSGTVNDGVSASYNYDKADNRTNVTVSTGGAAPPSFSINDISVTEGGSLSFTVTKSGSTTSSFNVDYATANGTAAAGSDYTAKSGTLTFTSSQATQAISVVTIDDTVVESAETVLFNLSNATGGATISDAQGVGTINDNDTPTNQPPVTNPDSITLAKCRLGSKDVVANDTDPEGNTPLTLTAVTQSWASVASSTTVGIEAPATNGTYVAIYTVADSLGATSTGTLTLTVSGTQQCV